MEVEVIAVKNLNQTTETRWIDHLDMVILKMLFVVLTIGLNFLVVFVFTCLIRKRTYTNYLFLSISISDLGIGLFAMTSQVIADIGMRWPLGLPICLLSQFSQLALPDITIQALLFLTIQRYMQLRYPMVTCERLNVCNLFKLALLWSLSSLFWSICLIIFISRGLLDLNMCYLEYPNLAFVLIKETLTSILPIVAIVFLNAQSISYLYNKKYRLLSRTRTYRFMSAPDIKMTKTNVRLSGNNSGGVGGGGGGSHHRRMRSRSMMNKNKRRNSKLDDKVLQNMRRITYAKLNRNLKALGCLFALTFCVVLTQTPYIILWPIRVYYNSMSSDIVRKVYNLTVWIFYLTSLINSILIFVFNEAAKRELKKFFRRHFLKRTHTLNNRQ